MSEVQVFTQKGEGKTSNEDRAVYGENWMAVFDGATQAEPPADGKDGGWYAEHLSQNVKRILDDQPDLELAQVVHDAIKQLVTDHPLDPDTAPSSTVAIARWREDSVDMYVLGDSFIVWETEDGERHELTDDRLQRVAVAEREAYRAVKADSSATQDEVRQSLAVLQRAERQWRNKPGGYWIASNSAPAQSNARVSSIDFDRYIEIACFTDGFQERGDVMNVMLAPAGTQDDSTLCRILFTKPSLAETQYNYLTLLQEKIAANIRQTEELKEIAFNLGMEHNPLTPNTVLRDMLINRIDKAVSYHRKTITSNQMHYLTSLTGNDINPKMSSREASSWISLLQLHSRRKALARIAPKTNEPVVELWNHVSQANTYTISSIGINGNMYFKQPGLWGCSPTRCTRSDKGVITLH